MLVVVAHKQPVREEYARSIQNQVVYLEIVRNAPDGFSERQIARRGLVRSELDAFDGDAAALRAKPIVHDDLAASLDALVGEQGVVPRRDEVAALREPDANQLGLAPFDDVAYMRGSCFGSYQIADTQVANGALAAIGHEHEG
ncbi:MAG: hypothetical protein ACLR3C_03990 [Eggerthella lenta]